jgi:MFS transporter, Spinster family, sphingosine-1-phosphate transporter
MKSGRPSWWGGPVHVAYTVVVFVVLASLDNAALVMLPSMVLPVTEALHTSEAAIGALSGATILVVALTAAVWGYIGDSRDRKPLLFWGTVIWSGGSVLSATAQSFWQLALWQMVVAVGLGAIASIGFSVISDFVGPASRGLAMSFWGLSQGIGAVVGALLASQLGAIDFTVPLLVIAGAGFLFAVLYIPTFEAPRGYKEPALASLFAAGGAYDYRIDRSQLRTLLGRRTNLWLILQGLTAQIAYGSLIWVPLLYQEKVIAQGYDPATGTRVGGLFSAIFTVGALFSILFGHLGDRLQRRTPRGRALLSMVGIVGAIPFFLVFFWVPLRGLDVTDGAGTVTLFGEVLASLFTNPWVALAFVSALIALALTSADSPNWFALISDVNLPEHRGTVFGMGNLVNGVGRSMGAAVTAAVAAGLERSLPPPVNWALGLSVFQVFFLPTGYCYWRASRTCTADIAEVRELLRQRANPSRE